MRPCSSSTSRRSTASIAAPARARETAPEITAHACATAMRVDVRDLVGACRQQIRVVLAGRERSRRDEPDALVEDAGIARDRDVARRDPWQPEEVVREMRTDAASERRVPPMEHVALDEPMRGMEENLGARQLRTRHGERRRDLQLIAEAERAARRVERRPPARAAAHG